MNKLTKHTSFLSLKLSSLLETPKPQKKLLEEVPELEYFFRELQKKMTPMVKEKQSKHSG